MFIISEYSKTLLLAAILIVAIRHVRDLYTLVWAFVCAAGILAFFTLFIFQMRVYGGVARIAGGYTYDANDIACVAVVSIPIAVWLLQAVKGKLKLIPLAVIIGLGMTLAKTGSRGGFVGLLAIGVAMLVMLRQVRLDKRLAFVAVIGLGLALAAPQGYWEQMRSITKPMEDYNWSAPAGRKAVLIRGLGYMARNPATGIGVGTFGRAEGMISDRARDYRPGMAGIKWSAAHNSFLQVTAEMGIPGLLLFCGLVFGSIRGMNRLRRSLPREWLRAQGERRFLYLATLYLPIALIGFAVAGFFVSFAYVDLVYVVAAFVAGTYVCVRAQLRGVVPVVNPAPSHGRPRLRRSAP
jgi:O-antigen ligase